VMRSDGVRCKNCDGYPGIAHPITRLLILPPSRLMHYPASTSSNSNESSSSSAWSHLHRLCPCPVRLLQRRASSTRSCHLHLECLHSWTAPCIKSESHVSVPVQPNECACSEGNRLAGTGEPRVLGRVPRLPGSISGVGRTPKASHNAFKRVRYYAFPDGELIGSRPKFISERQHPTSMLRVLVGLPYRGRPQSSAPVVCQVINLPVPHSLDPW